MNEVTVGIVGLVIVLCVFLTGMELAFAMILVGFLGFGYLISWDAAFNLLAKDVYNVLNSYSFMRYPPLCPHGPGGIQRRYCQKAL